MRQFIPTHGRRQGVLAMYSTGARILGPLSALRCGRMGLHRMCAWAARPACNVLPEAWPSFPSGSCRHAVLSAAHLISSATIFAKELLRSARLFAGCDSICETRWRSQCELLHAGGRSHPSSADCASAAPVASWQSIRAWSLRPEDGHADLESTLTWSSSMLRAFVCAQRRST